MQKNWLTLFPDTFIWIKGDEGLIYNAKKFKGFRFIINDRIEKICKKLLFPDSLYSTTITNEDLKNTEIKEWINSITRDCEAGYLTIGSAKSPVSFKPILKMFSNIDYFIWEHQRESGGNILQNIHELTIHLNTTGLVNYIYFKQTIFPLDNYLVPDANNLLFFIQNCQSPFLLNVNLVGNIFIYPEFKNFINKVTNLVTCCTICITIQDLVGHIHKLKTIQWPKNIRFNVLFDSNTIHSWISFQNISVFIFVTYIVCSENEYELFFDHFKDIPIYCDARVIPIYNKDNLHFFRNNVFMDQEDLNQIVLTKREIFIHQTLNTNDFGKLTILQDGSVYANVNMERLGTVEESPYSLVYKELTEGKSWRRIRDNKPCCDCIYQWLCPSPSNYELVIGQPNLCHVKL